MKRASTLLMPAGLLFSVAALGQATQSAAPALAPTIASAVDQQITTIEQLVVAAAEAMPEDKYNFSPEGLNLPGSDYKGVRTFALQVRHVAASNYALWAPLTGEAIPDDWKGGNGPETLKTKAAILQFLKDSFALGHRAAATLTIENMLMVEYLRMNGIVPPASRGK